MAWLGVDRAGARSHPGSPFRQSGPAAAARPGQSKRVTSVSQVPAGPLATVLGGTVMEDSASEHRRMAWRILGWALALGSIVGWVLLLHSPGTLPWVVIAVATVGVVVLVTSLWSARPRRGPTP